MIILNYTLIFIEVLISSFYQSQVKCVLILIKFNLIPSSVKSELHLKDFRESSIN